MLHDYELLMREVALQVKLFACFVLLGIVNKNFRIAITKMWYDNTYNVVFKTTCKNKKDRTMRKMSGQEDFHGK